MARDISLSVEQFRTQLRSELTKICEDLGKKYDNNQDRGYAFEVWVADLLLKFYDIEGDGSDFVYASNDLKIDIAFEDDESKTLCLVQTKCVSIPSNPDIPEEEVNDFYSRHDLFCNETKWVRNNASDQLHDLVCDYSTRLDDGWNVYFYFVSTGTASKRVKDLVSSREESLKKKFPSLNFILLDFLALKDQYISSRAIEATISDYVDIQFQKDKIIFKKDPHLTVLSIVKGNKLVDLYRKEKESLFAYNFRSFLGKRVNKEVVHTAVTNPKDFYYFNNGVSAICTEIEDLGNNVFRFHHFQVINGAQTIGSLKAAGTLDPACEVILRITVGASVKTEKGFNADIIRYNNTQNVIRASDFRSNDNIQQWLEHKFNGLKARGAIKTPIRYVRKRSFQRVRGAYPIKLEELAKIRYSYFFEPTRSISDPRSLWTGAEDGGYYESAFGVSGVIEDSWGDETFDETLFAVVVFIEVMKRINKLIKQDRSKYYFLQRLRYWAVALSAIHIRLKKIDYRELLEASAKFDKWFEDFWRDIFRDLISAYQQAQTDKISNFALARSETRWNQVKQQVDLVLGANIN